MTIYPKYPRQNPGNRIVFFCGGASASEIQFLLGRPRSLWLSSLRSYPFPSVEAQSAGQLGGLLAGLCGIPQLLSY